MRVAFIGHPTARAVPPSSSIEIYNFEVGRRLAAGGDAVTIIGPRLDGPVDETVDGVEVHCLDIAGDWRLRRLIGPTERLLGSRLPLFATRAFFPLYFRRAAETLAARGCDVVHVHDFLGAVPRLRAALPGARIVLHLNSEWLSALPRRFVAGPTAEADVIAAPSSFLLDRIAGSLPELADRLALAPNGVDTREFAPPDRRQGKDSTIHILAVGRISPEKGIHVLLDAFDRVLDQDPGACLDLVGKEAVLPLEMLIGLSDDPRVADLRRFYPPPYLDPLLKAASPRVRDAVRLVGEVDHAGTIAEYRRAAILVNCSLSESFGMSTVEGMASGLPVVASRVGGLPDIVEEDETGLLVEPGDSGALSAAIGRMLLDAGLRERLGINGRARAVERFDWDVVTRLARDTVVAPGTLA